MASLSNGSLPDKNAKKRPLENGHCVQVKYKPRRVSAIRDFPPGCGWDVGPINVNPLENIVAVVAADKVPDVAKADGAKTFKIDSEFESDVSQINREPQENAENSVGAYRLLDILEVAVPVQIELEDGAAEIIDGIEVVKPLAVSQPNIAPELLEELNQEESEVLVKELTMGKTQSLKKEELSLSDVAEVQPSAKELCSSGFVSCNKCDVKNINDFDIPVGSSSKSKHPQKRVSAIRDFPPFCGRNAPPPTEEDLARINFGKKNSLKDVTGAGTSRGKVRAADEDLGGKFEVVVYSHEKSLTNRKTSSDKLDLEGGDVDGVVVQGLMAPPTKGKKCDFNRPEKEELKNEIVQGLMAAPTKAKKRDFTGQEKSRHGSSMMKTSNKNFSSRELKKKLPSPHTDICDLVVKDREDFSAHNEEETEVSPTGRGSVEFEVTLPPFGPNSSSHGDARNRVRETLRLFHAICRKVLQGEEAKSRNGEQRKSKKDIKRIDLFAAKTVKDKGKEVNTEKQILGAVPGVEVGDEFQFRVELAIIGIHRLYQAGIDFIKHKGENVAASVVASGSYDDELNNPDVLIYSGQGGLSGKDKQPEDQKLERGNLALKNSISAKNPVRVIRGSKESKTSESANVKGRPSMTYVYDGLYKVDRYWQEVGSRGKLMFKFELRRIHGQPELAWKEVKQSNKTKTRDGLCIDDISGGEEETRICVVNTIDNERPPPFKYVTKMIYPNYCLRSPLKGCDCKGRCSDSGKCLCAEKNGGIPYNHNRAIVEMKPLVYECGPRCKCPPSCYNRVSQHGIKFQLEIFKTESRGWGVRSLNSIPSGSFICEYTGELLEDGEAEKRTGNDEYLFDIGQNYNDCAIDGGGPQASCSNIGDDGGFVIDAAKFGNVGRFINHSCSPNLYAQNVLYDHVDKRMPHIMLFAAENIPPLQELTYHYNYSVDQIHDSNGNIKMKVCYCGSAECTGRMY